MQNEQPIHALRNIGQTTARWLVEAQIETIGELEHLGTVEAYRRVKVLYPDKVSLNLLYALHAGLLGIKWTDLPQELKEELKADLSAIEHVRR